MRLRVGRRKEPILDYVSKNYEKKIQEVKGKEKETYLTNLFNPFPPSVPIWHRLEKLSILILEGFIKTIPHERRDYESVDEKILS